MQSRELANADSSGRSTQPLGVIMSKYLVAALAAFAFLGVAQAADPAANPAANKDNSLSGGAKAKMPAATDNAGSPSTSSSSGAASGEAGATGNGAANPAGKKDSGSLSTGAKSALPAT